MPCNQRHCKENSLKRGGQMANPLLQHYIKLTEFLGQALGPVSYTHLSGESTSRLVSSWKTEFLCCIQGESVVLSPFLFFANGEWRHPPQWASSEQPP